MDARGGGGGGPARAFVRDAPLGGLDAYPDLLLAPEPVEGDDQQQMLHEAYQHAVPAQQHGDEELRQYYSHHHPQHHQAPQQQQHQHQQPQRRGALDEMAAPRQQPLQARHPPSAGGLNLSDAGGMDFSGGAGGMDLGGMDPSGAGGMVADGPKPPSGPPEGQAAWVAERRRAVAKASKTARQKKKREMADLLEENKRLRSERAEFLAEIEELVAKVQEMREGGDIDTQIENELLKAQLEEYNNFIRALQRMAAGIPTNDVTKRRLYEKGADYAISYVLSLLTRSVREKKRWRRADLPVALATDSGQPKLAMWFRHVDDFKPATGERLQVRVDQLIPGIKPEALADVYWSLWNDQTVTQQFFNFADSEKNWENIKIEHVISESIDRGERTRVNSRPAQVDDAPQLIKVSYTRQFDPDADWVYVSTRTQQDISQAALHLPMAADRSDETGANDMAAPREDAQGKAAAARPGSGEDIKCATCYILARSTTTHHKMMLPASALEALENSAPREGQTINSFYLESCVVWEDEGASSGGCPSVACPSSSRCPRLLTSDGCLALEILSMRMGRSRSNFANTFVDSAPSWRKGIRPT